MGQRYQREIEEILKQVGNDTPAEPETPKKKPKERNSDASRPSTRRGFGLGPGRSLLWVSPGRLFMVSVGLLLAALVLRAVIPAAMAPVAWTAVALFVVAYVLFFLRPRSPYEKRWRGRLVEDEPVDSWWQRVRHWLTQR